ncbi:MAG: glycosyltransferase, partial [Cyanobacteria bacterium P01_F01_bin.42]
LILLESLACGTPVTCTPIGGMPEAIKAFTPELVMDDIQTEDIVTMLRSILGGKVSLPESDRCRDYVLENFDWKDIGQRVREVLLQPN